VIFTHNLEQKEIAEKVCNTVASYYEDPIVTEITEVSAFYKAEEEHQNYYKSHPNQGYCSFVITPKLMKLRKLHSEKLKTGVQ
jgi:peptide-methionine (S)-S-oxide reductase